MTYSKTTIYANNFPRHEQKYHPFEGENQSKTFYIFFSCFFHYTIYQISFVLFFFISLFYLTNCMPKKKTLPKNNIPKYNISHTFLQIRQLSKSLFYNHINLHNFTLESNHHKIVTISHLENVQKKGPAPLSPMQEEIKGIFLQFSFTLCIHHYLFSMRK